MSVSIVSFRCGCIEAFHEGDVYIDEKVEYSIFTGYDPASDAHSSHQRTPRLDNGYRQIASRYGKWTADLLLREHPNRMIRDETLEVRGFARHVARFPIE